MDRPSRGDSGAEAPGVPALPVSGRPAELESRLIALVRSSSVLMRALRAARTVDPPDWLIGAGAVRERVWDHLHGFAHQAASRDLDLAFFDPDRLGSDAERSVQMALTEQAPDISWDVTNHAAAHLWYPDVFGVALAPLGNGGAPADFARALLQAGFRVQTFPEYRAMKWSKLLLNILGNATSAILDVPPSEIARSPRLFALERDAFREAVRVMQGLSLQPVALPGYPVPALVRVMGAPAWIARRIVGPKIGGGRGAKMPSLWEDLDRGRERSEVEVLNGAVAREGAALGIPTPVNALLTEVLMALAAGRRDREAFRRKPEALVALLRTSAAT